MTESNMGLKSKYDDNEVSSVKLNTLSVGAWKRDILLSLIGVKARENNIIQSYLLF